MWKWWEIHKTRGEVQDFQRVEANKEARQCLTPSSFELQTFLNSLSLSLSLCPSLCLFLSLSHICVWLPFRKKNFSYPKTLFWVLLIILSQLFLMQPDHQSFQYSFLLVIKNWGNFLWEAKVHETYASMRTRSPKPPHLMQLFSHSLLRRFPRGCFRWNGRSC